jgi:hypothetical protein
MTLVSPAVSHETIAPFAPLHGAGVERTGLNMFAVSGCILAVFVGGDYGQLFQLFEKAKLFLLHSVSCDRQHNVSVLNRLTGFRAKGPALFGLRGGIDALSCQAC